MLTGLVNSSPMPLPSANHPKDALIPSTTTAPIYDESAWKLLHSACRKRDSDEFSNDDDPKAQYRLARFFPDCDPAMDSYKTLPSEIAVKLAEHDKRLSMTSQLSVEERRSYDSDPETLEVLEGFKHERRDSGLSITTVEDDIQVAKAIPLRRAVRKSFYPLARPDVKWDELRRQ